jgi:hypothetical protein
MSRIFSPAASLKEDCDAIFPEILLDHFRRRADKIRGVSTAGGTLDRMASELVENGQRSAIHPIESNNSDSGIDRPDSDNLIVGGERIRVPDIDLATILHSKATVLHNSIFGPDASPDLDRYHSIVGQANRFNGPIGHVIADHAMAVAGVDHQLLTRNPKFGLQAFSDGRQIVVFDVPDFTDRNRMKKQGQALRLGWSQGKNRDRHCVSAGREMLVLRW